jgi:hypothetical protein
MDILSIHKATAEDPTVPGSSATDSLRRSKDPFNPAFTFSIVFRRKLLGRVTGLETFDMECSDEEQYVCLLRGFTILHQERMRASELAEDSAVDPSAFATDALRRAEDLWTSGRNIISKRRVPRSSVDPVAKLFEPSVFLDPWQLVGLKAKQQRFGAQKLTLAPSRFLGWSSAGTQIWARLHMSGLEVKCVYSHDLSRVLLKVRCPDWRLEEMAERMRIKLRNKKGIMRRFKISRRDAFVETSNGTLFNSGERQQIIDHIIRSKIKDGGAELDENTDLGKHVVQCFPLHMTASLDHIRHQWVTFWKSELPGEIPPPWSLWTTPWRQTSARLVTFLSYARRMCLYQPLDPIAEYYGEGVGFLSAYMAFYTRWLITPSVLGLVVFFFQLKDRRLDHWLCLPFAIFVMLWATFMLAYWRQKQSALAHRWGVLDYEVEETERPQFKYQLQYDDASGEYRKVYPVWKRGLRYLVSLPVLATIMVVVLLLMFTIFSTQDRLLHQYNTDAHSLDFTPVLSSSDLAGIGANDAGQTSYNSSLASNSTAVYNKPLNFSLSVASDGTFWVIAIFYPSLYSLLLVLTSAAFDFIALRLNAFENHRTQTAFVNRLILKVFSFRFIASFTSLYWYAFNPYSDAGDSYIRVSMVLFCLLTVSYWGEAALEVVLPSLTQRFELHAMRHALSSTRRSLYRAKEHDDQRGGARKEVIELREAYMTQAASRVWQEASQISYTTFTDYASLVVQLGFILFFAAIFPLAPLIALCNNLFMMRLRAYKICYTMQRPLAQKTSGMGVWEDILQIMTVLGVLTNLALFGITSNVMRDGLKSLGAVGIAVLLFVFEHIMLFFKYWLYTSLPRVPAAVMRSRGEERTSTMHIKHSAVRLKSLAPPDDNDADEGRSVPLLAPLDELRFMHSFSIDGDYVVAQQPAYCNSDDEMSDSPLVKRTRPFSVEHPHKLSYTPSPSSIRNSQSASVAAIRTSGADIDLDRENRYSSLNSAAVKAAALSDSDSDRSLDSSDSEAYELARQSRSALSEIKNETLACTGKRQQSSMKQAKESLGKRLRDFQSRRLEAELELSTLNEIRPLTPTAGKHTEVKASRQSILGLLGWWTAKVSDESDGEEASESALPLGQSALSLEEKLRRVETLKPAIKLGPLKTAAPHKANRRVKLPDIASHNTPNKNMAILTNNGSSFTSRKQPTSPPQDKKSSRLRFNESQTQSKSQATPVDSPRSAVRRKIEEAQLDRLPVKVVIGTSPPRPKAKNPFSFVDDRDGDSRPI